MAGRSDLPHQRPVPVVAQPDHPVFGFHASSRKLDPAKNKGPDALGPEGPRDAEAWAAYDEIPEAGSLVDDPAALLSQCRLYAGWIDQRGEHQHLRDEDGVPVEAFPEQFVADCETTLARVVDAGGSQRGLIFAQAQNNGVTGDAYMVGWSIDQDGEPVEETDPGVVGERWEVVARGAVGKARGRWTIQLSGAKAVRLPSSAVVYRMWTKHPRRPDQARSWLVRSLDVVRDLRVFTLAQRAAARSSIPAAVWVVPEEASPKIVNPSGFPAGGQVPDTSGAATPVPGGGPPGFAPGFPAPIPGSVGPGSGVAAPESWGQQLERLLGNAIMEAIGDSNSGRAVIPSVITVTKDYVDAFKDLDLHRPIDTALAGLVDQAIKRLARAADCPPEMLEGLGETNRWNGAQIADDEFRRYFKPKADAIADSWTVEVLWGGLRALGHPEELIRQVRVLVDPKGVVAEPDRFARVLDVFRLGGASYAALRDAAGLSEEDAPSPEEQAFIAENFGRRTSSRSADGGDGEVNRQAGSALAALPPDTVAALREVVAGWAPALPPARAELAAPAPPDTDSATADEGPEPASAEVIPGRRAALGKLHARTAASIETDLTGDQIAEQLAAIDTLARTRLEEAAEAAFAAALSRAGAKLKSWARRDQDLRALLARVDSDRVAETLGPERAASVAALFATDEEQRREELFAAALLALLGSYERITRPALVQALRVLLVAVVDPGEQPPSWARATVPAESLAAAVTRGGEILRTSMIMLADARIFAPAAAPTGGLPGIGPLVDGGVTTAPAATTVGEVSSLQVPPFITGAALAAAAGAAVEASLSPQQAASQGILGGPIVSAYLPEVEGWRWVYGSVAERRHPWQPHLGVDLQVFSGPGDPRLAGLAPNGGPGFPGDHGGCRCAFVPVLADPTW